jgi:hypothetical protein
MKLAIGGFLLGLVASVIASLYGYNGLLLELTIAGLASIPFARLIFTPRNTNG